MQLQYQKLKESQTYGYYLVGKGFLFLSVKDMDSTLALLVCTDNFTLLFSI